MGKRVLIVGGVAGGASCAARLRRLDEEAEIIMFERGPYISYANCGLPYYTGGTIRSRDALLLQSPEGMKEKFNLDVRVMSEVTKINRAEKTITVKGPGGEYEEEYDVLVIATGSSPLKPPIPGIDGPRVRALWTVPDADEVKKLVKPGQGTAAVIGGGFIGVETAENLREAGFDVVLGEAVDQVMAPFDKEMALLIEDEMRANGVDLRLGDGVKAFHDTGKGVNVELASGHIIEADFAVCAIGVRPNGQIAKEAGLTVNQRGGIVVDDFMRTSDPDIYAVGDVVEINDLVSGGRAMIPLAGPANRQGRIAADNIAGYEEKYEGSLGTAVAKVFDLTCASTGANEKQLKQRGLEKGRDYKTATIMQNSHATYYPGAKQMTLKLIFAPDGKKLFGAQIVGRDGVDKRIDTIATTIRLGGGVEALTSLELAYAPPFSSAKDPVNMLGFAAQNVIRGLSDFAPWDVVEKGENIQVVDVREDAEVAAFQVPGAVHIPQGALRERLGELDKSKNVVVFCAMGVRAHSSARVLRLNGFENVSVYPGGTRYYQATHPAPDAYKNAAKATAKAAAAKIDPSASVLTVRLDCVGMQCPGPITKVFESIHNMKPGDMLEVVASDPGFMRDINAWCRRTGNTLVSSGKKGNDYIARVMKGEGTPSAADGEAMDGKTIVVFSGDLDRALASFIIANGAAAMGRKVTMFFTFWGLTILRRPEKKNVEKSFVEKMFGFMLPRGTKKLKLSRMNMLGAGSAMMRDIMRQKNVDSLDELIRKARAAGVRLIACTMSMDVMGIKQEELIDGVDLGGVGAYLGDAEESDVNLFI
jgi:NADPH-dependent 2,4-dienoyl-CoA reductase/sulfur reductase-like enzyme/peroxiredoxin family protein/rhodanese-related sulfurtransferase/TusA-related sulfurtransferase